MRGQTPSPLGEHASMFFRECIGHEARHGPRKAVLVLVAGVVLAACRGDVKNQPPARIDGLRNYGRGKGGRKGGLRADSGSVVVIGVVIGATQ